MYKLALNSAVDGSAKSTSVSASPWIVTKFDKSKNLVQGDTLDLTCNSWAWPMPTIEWYRTKDGEAPELIASGGRFKLGNTTSLTFFNSTLTIQSMQYADYMSYECLVSNNAGNISGSTLVRVKGMSYVGAVVCRSHLPECLRASCFHSLCIQQDYVLTLQVNTKSRDATKL